MDITYEIWKMPCSNKKKFMRLDWIDNKVNITDYICVYRKKYSTKMDITNKNFLNNLWETFNINEPNDYFSEPLCVSDVICIIDNDKNKRTWYYIDSNDFKKIKI